MENYLKRLYQGVGDIVKGTYTIFFIRKYSFPAGRKVSYCKQEATIRPNKEDTHCVQNCAGGDLLD